MWSALGELPYDLWATKIVPLLDLRDLVRIDTAIVSKSGRDGFSAVLNYHCVQVDDCRVKGNVADTFRWINERCIKVDAVKIARDRITALCAVDQLLRFAGSISVSFSNVVECMAGGWQHVSSNTLSRVNELAIHAPFRSGEDPFFIDKDRIVAETIQRFPRLSKLTIGLCGSVGHYICQALSSSGSLLEEFSVIPYVVSSAMQVIATLADSCPQLRRFSLHYSITYQDSTSANLALLAHQCRLLVELSFTPPNECVDTFGSAAEVIAASKCLTKLSCRLLVLDGAALAAWVNGNAKLTVVELSWGLYAKDVPDSAADALARLRELKIHDVSATCGLLEALRFTVNLRTLLIRTVADPDVYVSLAVVTQLANTCRQLIQVEFDNCKGLTGGDAVDAAFASLAERNQNLQSLTVYTCNLIGDRTVLAIAAHCPQFRRLEVTHGLHLTDDTILALIRGCSHLTEVSTFGNVTVAEVSLVALADHGHACLETLSLRTGLRISAATEQALRERCPKLRFESLGPVRV
jgi:hypothetical protein